MTDASYYEDRDFADFVNENLIGKTIKCARANPNPGMVHCVLIEFTDGTKIEIRGRRYESFLVDYK